MRLLRTIIASASPHADAKAADADVLEQTKRAFNALSAVMSSPTGGHAAAGGQAGGSCATAPCASARGLQHAIAGLGYCLDKQQVGFA